jgi:hypothetical protein
LGQKGCWFVVVVVVAGKISQEKRHRRGGNTKGGSLAKNGRKEIKTAVTHGRSQISSTTKAVGNKVKKVIGWVGWEVGSDGRLGQKEGSVRREVWSEGRSSQKGGLVKRELGSEGRSGQQGGQVNREVGSGREVRGARRSSQQGVWVSREVGSKERSVRSEVGSAGRLGQKGGQEGGQVVVVLAKSFSSRQIKAVVPGGPGGGGEGHLVDERKTEVR